MEKEPFYYTFGIIKPDAMEYKKEIIDMIEKNGFKVIYAKYQYLDEKLLEEHYAHCKYLQDFPNIIKSMMASPVMLLVIYDQRGNAIEGIRKLQGATKSWEAKEGTIRERFGSKNKVYLNAFHASGTPVEVAQEIFRFFPDDLDDIIEKVQKQDKINQIFTNGYKFIDSQREIEKAEEEYLLRKKYNGEK